MPFKSASSAPDTQTQAKSKAPVASILNDRARLAAFQFQDRAWPTQMVVGGVVAFELVLLALASAMFSTRMEIAHLLPIWAQFDAVLAAVGLAAVFQAYRLSALVSLGHSAPRLGAALVVPVTSLAIFEATRHGTSQDEAGRLTFWILVLSLTWILLRAISVTVVQRLQQKGKLQRRAVLVGGGQRAADLIHFIEKSGDNHVLICGIFDDRHDERSPPVVEGIPHLGRIDELVEFGRLAKIDLLIVTVPASAEDRMLMLLKKLWVLPVDIRVSALGSKLRYHRRTYNYVGSVPCLSLFDKPIDGWGAVGKRVFDLFFATLAIVMLSPIMLGTAIAVRLDSPGPIFFKQRRYGYNNESTDVLKFRSMYHNMADPAAKVVVTKNDPRVTRVGRIIRKTSIDELPQLFNVLQGKLSLVGPRPHALNAHTQNQLWEEVVEGYFARHKVKPGVTGWAQINGLRGEVDSTEKLVARVEHDLYYIEQWSVLFDLYILFKTPFRLLGQENAY